MLIDNLKLVRKYANALFEFTKKEKKLDTVYEEMQYFIKIIKNSDQFNLFFISPVFNFEQKIKFIENQFNNFSIITKKFIYLIIRNKREQSIFKIFKKFQEFYNIYKGVVSVYITTNKKMSTQIIKKIVYNSNLIKKKEFSMIINNNIDSSIIGGYILSIENYQIDTSISSFFLKLKKLLTANKK